jgi:hypothetical protein
MFDCSDKLLGTVQNGLDRWGGEEFLPQRSITDWFSDLADNFNRNAAVDLNQVG